MAAVHTDIPAPSSRDRPVRSSSRAPLLGRSAAAVAASACAAGGVAVASAYPFMPTLVVAAFAAWAAFAFARFPVALPAMLAVLPISGLATFTGWMTFEELDLLILASAAGGYAARAFRPTSGPASERHGSRLSIVSIALIALFAASTIIALERGIAAAGGLRFDWFQGYEDPLNSLRIFKSFAWAVLLAPLLLAELRKPGGLDRIGTGMTVALGLCGLAILQERIAFTGLLDFSGDYRVTGPFWEMHVGGAALDGFLALTIPFAVREAVLRSGATRGIVALGVLALAAYACLVTFSRGVYAAIPLSLLLLVVLVFRQRLRAGRRELWWLLPKGLLFTVAVAVAGFVVFRAGGYRAVIAAFTVLALAIPAEAAIRRTKPATWAAAAVAASLAAAAGFIGGGFLPKGPYLVFALAAAATVAAAAALERKPTQPGAMLVIVAWLCLAVCACIVARHWGGSYALRDSAAVVGALVALSFAASRLKRPAWPERRSDQLATVGFAALVMGSVAVFTGGAYMGGRFSSTGSDLDLRMTHWTEGIGRLHGVDDWLFGKGLGRFPATSRLESTAAEVPGNYRISRRDGETFLALTGPRMRYLGFGELLRFSQRVSVTPDTTYLVTLQARSSKLNDVHVELCEKHLIYNGACVEANPQVTAGLEGWRQIDFRLQTGSIGASAWYARRPVFFAIAAGNPGAVLEIRSMRMIGPDGADVLANSSFTNRTERWFSSSDKFHLPWHIKNMALDVLFDQGVVGLALFVLLIGGALLRTSVGRAFRHPDAPYVAAAIAGFLVVGAFDSLLDVPRVAFAFYVVTLLALMLRNPRAATAPPVGPVPSAAPVSAPVAPDGDDAGERARRRQRAFGERRPIER